MVGIRDQGQWTEVIDNRRKHQQDAIAISLWQSWNFSQMRGPLTAQQGGAEVLAGAQQGGERQCLGVGKQGTRKQVSLCVCTCCLIQNVSKLVSHKHFTCVSCVVLKYTPAARHCWHSHDPHASLNKPHAKQDNCLEFLRGNAAALGFSKDNFC